MAYTIKNTTAGLLTGLSFGPLNGFPAGAAVSVTVLTNDMYAAYNKGVISINPLPGGVPGGPLQVTLAATDMGLPLSVPSSTTSTSNVVGAQAFNYISVGVTPAQAGLLKIQPYVDAAGTIPQGAAVTSALTAATPAALTVNLSTAGGPFQSFVVSVSNSSAGGPSSIANFVTLLSGH